MEDEKNNSKEEKQYTAQEVVDIIKMKMDNSKIWDLWKECTTFITNTRSDYKNPSAEV